MLRTAPAEFFCHFQQQLECARSLLSLLHPTTASSSEAVSVEWAEKCVSLTLRCPCGKGYEVLISANNCYYELL